MSWNVAEYLTEGAVRFFGKRRGAGPTRDVEERKEIRPSRSTELGDVK